MTHASCGLNIPWCCSYLFLSQTFYETTNLVIHLKTSVDSDGAVT